MAARRKSLSKSKDIEYEKRLARTEEMLLGGVKSIAEMASMFGIQPGNVSQMVQKIEARWAEERTKDNEALKTKRIRQLENVMRMATDGYLRSRKDVREYQYTTRPCMNCGATGKVQVKRDGVTQTEDCKDCQAKGEVTVEVLKVKGNPGDPRFLSMMKDCIVECARLEGHYPAKMMASGRITTTSKEIGGEIEERVEEIFFEGSTDTLIDAMVALDKLDARIARREKNSGPVIDVDPKEDGDAD